jgi:catechol 2,3-dioxygenase-like lactoylglutathione lyase family enzyme
MEHVGIVVDDLAAATAFFVELGLMLQGEWSVERGWVDGIVGLEGVRAEYAMLETPDGHGRARVDEVSCPVGERKRASADSRPTSLWLPAARGGALLLAHIGRERGRPGGGCP